MNHMMQTPTNRITIAQRIQAISQTGIAYAQNAYDVDRYKELSEIVAAMMAGPELESVVLAKRLFAAEEGYSLSSAPNRGKQKWEQMQTVLWLQTVQARLAGGDRAAAEGEDCLYR